MRAAILVAALVLFAGCTSTVPEERPQPPTLGFVAARVDLDGDGLYDAVNITLLAAPGPITGERLAFLRDGERLPSNEVLRGDVWRPGSGALIRCEPGVHEFEVRIDGETKELVVLECGVAASRQPPLFRGRLIDGDADGLLDAIELELLEGGPLPPTDLAASLGELEVRVYENALKARLARGAMPNGTRVYTPCHPDADDLTLVWRDQVLPALPLRGCDVFVAGVDVPLSVGVLDLDADRAQDGWNLTLGGSVDGPFEAAEIVASWGNRSAALNGSIALTAMPATWTPGATLVATCPEPGTMQFSMHVRGILVFRSVTVCERPPGEPLVELAFEARDGRLLATLVFSRVGAIDAGNATIGERVPVGEGRWPVGETRSLACPGGELVLHEAGRLLFRGEAPC